MAEEKNSETSMNELFKEGHVESPNGFITRSQNNNYHNNYVSNFTHNLKIENKNKFCIYFIYFAFISISMSTSLVFVFDYNPSRNILTNYCVSVEVGIVTSKTGLDL